LQRYRRRQNQRDILFRAVSETWDEAVIKEIAGWGMRLVSLRRRQHNGGRRQQEGRWGSGRGRDEDFEKELGKNSNRKLCVEFAKIAEIAPLRLFACMESMSKWDSRLLWKYYDYRGFWIIGERI